MTDADLVARVLADQFGHGGWSLPACRRWPSLAISVRRRSASTASRGTPCGGAITASSLITAHGAVRGRRFPTLRRADHE